MARGLKEENLRLRSLLDEAAMSNKGLARRVVDLAATRGLASVRCDHTSVLRWLAGEQPRPPVPELAAEVLSNALGRKVSETELGMTPSDLPGDLGLQLPTGWTETIATSTALWRADVQRRRFLVNAVFTSAALPASALRWLTSPPAAAPAASGTRKVGRADIDAIRELTRSYREMDNRLGGGKLRSSIVSYLDDHVSRLLTAGSYQEETGRQLAAACGELSQLAGWVAYDSDEHGLAQRYLTQALAYSRHADDHALAAEVLAAQAHQALYLARPDEAVDLARAAQAAAVRHGSATLLTECLVMEAHGHAARNDAHACGAALARAEQTFDRAAREDDPAWLAYFDEAYLAARMAQCFRDLGEAGHAARYARRSLDMDGRYVRGRAFNLSLLATAYAAQGEPVQASAVGRQALDLTVRLTSARSVRYVRDLVRDPSPASTTSRRSATSRRRYASGCPPQQGMLHPDDGDRAQDVAPGDHRRRLVNRHPADLGRLVHLRLPDKLGPVRQVQVLRVVGVADNRLAGHDELDTARAPARLLLHLARRRRGRVLSVVHVAARQLPHPAVHDEPVPAHHQHPLARVVQDHRHRAAPHPEDVLREPHVVRKLDIGQAHADVRGVVHQPLAVDHPLVRVSHVRDTTGPGSRRPATVDPTATSDIPGVDLRYTCGPTCPAPLGGQHRFSTRPGNDGK